MLALEGYNCPTTFTFFAARMAATTLDTQKTWKNGLKCTRKDEAQNTLECINPKNWFTLKSLKAEAML